MEKKNYGFGVCGGVKWVLSICICTLKLGDCANSTPKQSQTRYLVWAYFAYKTGLPLKGWINSPLSPRDRNTRWKPLKPFDGHIGPFPLETTAGIASRKWHAPVDFARICLTILLGLVTLLQYFLFSKLEICVDIYIYTYTMFWAFSMVFSHFKHDFFQTKCMNSFANSSNLFLIFPIEPSKCCRVSVFSCLFLFGRHWNHHTLDHTLDSPNLRTVKRWRRRNWKLRRVTWSR